MSDSSKAALPASSPADSTTHLESLFIGRGNSLQAHAAAHGGSVPSDPRGAFSFVHTFDSDVRLGGALVLSCWMDAASAERGRFCAALGQRAAARTREGKEERPLPCFTGYAREPVPPGHGDRLPVSLTMSTTPTLFKAGDQLVLTLTLAAPKGSDAVMRGVLYFGAGTDSMLTLSVIPVAGSTSGQEA